MKLIFKIALGVVSGLLFFILGWLLMSAIVVSSFVAATTTATDMIIQNKPPMIKPDKPRKRAMTERWVKGKSIKECYKIHGNELNVNTQRCRNGYKIKVYF